jgi:hypothetical protein
MSESPGPPVIWPRLATAWTPSPNAGARVVPTPNEVPTTTGRDAISPCRTRAAASDSPDQLGAYITLQPRVTVDRGPLAPLSGGSARTQRDRHDDSGRTIPFVANHAPRIGPADACFLDCSACRVTALVYCFHARRGERRAGGAACSRSSTRRSASTGSLPLGRCFASGSNTAAPRHRLRAAPTLAGPRRCSGHAPDDETSARRPREQSGLAEIEQACADAALFLAGKRGVSPTHPALLLGLVRSTSERVDKSRACSARQSGRRANRRSSAR